MKQNTHFMHSEIYKDNEQHIVFEVARIGELKKGKKLSAIINMKIAFPLEHPGLPQL